MPCRVPHLPSAGGVVDADATANHIRNLGEACFSKENKSRDSLKFLPQQLLKHWLAVTEPATQPQKV